ncbi:hypothetical protein QR680_011621 [Steinernema hermaphroditum]|uniref:Centaurin-gamma-1A n=1 Tax=Steinernema hermaphroditum TaxID=289476 RepID=A0AA39HZ75_9BILA|nr:hypothetical protein QR680_011621 [Steinernema hermaphroditum]
MPRRRGLYSLSKSSTHDVLPSAGSYGSFEPNNNTVDLNAAFCCEDDAPVATPLRRVKPAMSDWEMSKYYDTDDDNGNRENVKNVSFSLGKALPKIVRKSSMSSVLRELFRTPKKTKERVSRLSQSFCTPQASRAASYDPGRVRFRERSCQEPYPGTPKRFTVEERYTKRRDRDRERSRSRRLLRDSFVNSQEWTTSRNVIEIRLGVLGSLDSGKTALVHRYLTGAYTPEESPEGGRFKKEIHIDGQSYLLLIRDEGASFPEKQFAQWADAVIFVFALENRDSFETAIQCFKEMTKYRNCADMPMLLVGAQDNISGSKPRKVEESEGRRMAQSMHRCGYYETCSTYGLNVERVFKEVCQKALQSRPRWLHSSSSASGPRTSTSGASTLQQQQPLVHHDYQPVYAATTNNNGKPYHHQRSISALPLHDQQQFQRRSTAAPPQQLYHRDQPPPPASARSSQAFVMPGRSSHHQPDMPLHHTNAAVTSRSTTAVNVHPSQMDQLHFLQNEQFDNHNMVMTNQASASTSHLPTPNGTPTTQRKNRRISNIFQRQSKDHHLNSEEKAAKMSAEVNMGAGRAIPIKQGQLYKRSSKTLNREWKKKYVCLYPDGRLLYHHNIKDYMDKNSVGKEVYLGLATVKVSGRPVPRNTQRASTCVMPSTSAPGKENLVTAYEFLDGPTNGNGNSTPGDGTSGGSDADLNAMGLATSTSSSVVPTPAQKDAKKKRGHRRLGSGHKHNEEEDDCEFEIVTSDQKRWEFSATSVEERDEWVAAIEEQIELSLQAQMSQKQQHNSSRQHGDRAEVHGIREIAGNDRCADCGSLKPDWASLNLGTLICIECSGIHRNLGSHISKVRSLELDDWPMEYLRVMQAIGNERANRLWEHNAPRERKPASDATREQKEAWIKSKYEQKRFLPAVPVDRTFGKQILEAVSQRDMDALLVVLPRCEEKDLNAVFSSRDRRTALHLACSLGSVEFVQLLIWYNADIRVLDENGRSAMWYAQQAGSRECVDILKHNGLEMNYGMPSSAGSSSSASPADQMIMGSHVRNERDFAAADIRNQPSAAGACEIKLRRSTNADQQPAIPPHAPGFSERASKAFDYLPASVI